MSRIDGDRKNICGENIKRYREKEGLLLSAKELEQIEQGQKIVLDQEIICFCKALSITIEQLFEDISL